MQTPSWPEKRDGQITVWQKVLKGACRILETVLWTDKTKMNLYQRNGSKKGDKKELSKIQSIPANLLNMVIGMLWLGHVWLPHALAHSSSLVLELLMEVAQ